MMYSNRPMGLSKGIVMAAVSAMLLFSGCGGGTGRSGESEDTARLEYTPQNHCQCQCGKRGCGP